MSVVKKEAARSCYQELMATSPELFREVPGGIDILRTSEAQSAAEAAVAGKLAQSDRDRFDMCAGVLCQTPYFSVIQDAVKFPDGRLGLYSRYVPAVDLSPGAAILPIHDGEVLLLQHFRHATRSIHIECPRGFRQPDADPRETAIRELAEELGGEVADLVELGPIHTNTGTTSEVCMLFFGKLTSYGRPETADGILSVRATSVTDFEGMIRDGVITDAFTLCLFARARLRGLI